MRHAQSSACARVSIDPSAATAPSHPGVTA